MVQDGFHLAWVPLSRLSHEAVIVFFVLSGYVIAHSTFSRQQSWRHYTTTRLARILSVALPAIAFSFVIAAIIGENGSVWDATSSVLFLNESWANPASLPMNGPYWSLCYEVWYYALFGMAVFLPRRHQWLCLPAAIIAGPAILLLMPIWLLGVWLAGRPALAFKSYPQALGAAVAGIVIIIAVGNAGSGVDVAVQMALKEHIPGYWRLVYSQRFATDYLLALAVALHLIGIRSMIDRWSRGLVAVEGPLRFLASCSFSVYLFHRPISIAISRIQPNIGDPIMTSLLSCVVIGGACLLLATITEHRLAAWRSLLSSNSLRLGVRSA